MLETIPLSESADQALLAGWISRSELASALGLTADTLGRWEARRTGPPCVRAGRKVYYRRRAVQDWLAAQEMPRARTSGAGNEDPRSQHPVRLCKPDKHGQ